MDGIWIGDGWDMDRKWIGNGWDMDRIVWGLLVIICFSWENI